MRETGFQMEIKNENINNVIEAETEERKLTGREKALRKRFLKASERLHRGHVGFSQTLNLGFLLVLAAVVIGALALRLYIMEPTLVDGESMQNYLMDGERVAVNKTAYWLHEPQRGDIVIVHYPDRNERFVKRIIAFGGETIELRNGYVYINGEQLDESAYAGDWYGHITLPISTRGSVGGVYTVPEGHVFVMGDNRNDSLDSRSGKIGFINKNYILGKTIIRIHPISKWKIESKEA